MIERFDARETKIVQQVVESGELSSFFKSFRGGTNVQAFEQEFAEYLGVQHAVTVSNGTVALEIALKALNVKPGDEIITTPLSFIATATAILAVGAKPVFVDISPYNLNIAAHFIEDAITPKTVGIIPVSLLGYPADMPNIMEIAEKHGLFVLEDAAQALGASIDGQKIGSYGTAGCFSFQETKQLTTLGEGGMIVTDEDIIAEKSRYIRNHGNAYGSPEGYDSSVVCTNARMTEAQAAFGRVQLTKLDRFNKIQVENAEFFVSRLPFPPLREVYGRPMGVNPIYLLIPVVVSSTSLLSRQEIVDCLKFKGVSQGVPGQNVGYYRSLLYEYPILKRYKRRCFFAEETCPRLMLFDIHRWHTLQEMEKYSKILNEMFA